MDPEDLGICGVALVIIDFLAVAMTMWKMDMSLYHERREVKIEAVRIMRGIFQGDDSLLPLLFILARSMISHVLYNLYSLHGQSQGVQ